MFLYRVPTVIVRKARVYTHLKRSIALEGMLIYSLNTPATYNRCSYIVHTLLTYIRCLQ